MRKKIAILFLLVMSINICNQVLIGAVNTEYTSGNDFPETKIILDVIGAVGKVFMLPVSGLLSALLLLIEQMLNIGFSAISDTGFPYADSMVFNAVPLLDVNFINPAGGETPVGQMQGIIKEIYMLLWSLAAAFFSFALIFIGIKLATETIAHQKAKYKEALMSWILGLVMLFMLHFFMSFLFALNEELVVIASRIANQGEFDAGISGATTGMEVGTGGTAGATEDTSGKSVSVTGLASYFKDHLFKNFSIGGVQIPLSIEIDYFNMMAWGILMVQSIIFLFVYLKRIFYVVILAFFGPIIIVINTYQKTFTGKSSSLANWGKEFIITVMQQTFQAFLYAVIIRIIHLTGGTDEEIQSSYLGSGILSVACLFLVLKMDDILKKLIGWKDGMHGGIKGGLASVMTGVALAKGAVSAGRNVADNITKVSQGVKNTSLAERNLKSAESKYAREKALYGEVDDKGRYIPPSYQQSTSSPTPTTPLTENQIKDMAANAIIQVQQGQTQVAGDDTISSAIREMVLGQQQLISQLQQNGMNGIIGGNSAQGIVQGNGQVGQGNGQTVIQSNNIPQGLAQGQKITVRDIGEGVVQGGLILPKDVARAQTEKLEAQTRQNQQTRQNMQPRQNMQQMQGSSGAHNINVNGTELRGPYNNISELKEDRKNELKALQAKEVMNKAIEESGQKKKDAIKLIRQGVMGTVGAAGGIQIGAIAGMATGDATKTIAGAMAGTIIGDKIGEMIGASKIAGAPKAVGNTIDSLTGHAITGALTKASNDLSENLGKSVRSAQETVVKGLENMNVIAADSAEEMLKNISRKNKLAATKVDERMKRQLKRSTPVSLNNVDNM